MSERSELSELISSTHNETKSILDTQGKNIQSQSTQISTGISTISNLINAKGCIKSIQRGFIPYKNTAIGSSYVVNLKNTVNSNKSVLNLFYPHNNPNVDASNITLNDSNITITTNNISGSTWYMQETMYQVIEFY